VIGILHPQLALEDIWNAIRGDDKGAHAAAIELIENLAPKIRTRLLPMLARNDDYARLRAAGGLVPALEDALASMMNEDSPPLRELASALRARLDGRL